MAEKKEGLIKTIRTLLSADPLEEKKCLRINGVIGLLLLLPSILVFFIRDKIEFPFPPELVYVQISVGTIFAGGYVLAVCNSSLTRRILVLQGTVICLLVVSYTIFMWYVAQLVISGKMKVGMAHAPGILACGAAYGIKQVLTFSKLSSESWLPQRLPAICFVIGVCCDIFVSYLIYKCFF